MSYAIVANVQQLVTAAINLLLMTPSIKLIFEKLGEFSKGKMTKAIHKD